jgi:hypothetical protein
VCNERDAQREKFMHANQQLEMEKIWRLVLAIIATGSHAAACKMTEKVATEVNDID